MADEFRALQGEVTEVQKTVAEHGVRLEGGAKTFEGLRDKDVALGRRIDKVDEKLAPKPVNYIGLIALIFSITMGLAGSLWGLSVLFSSRPTTEQLDKLMDEHGQQPHPGTQKQINELRKQQLEFESDHAAQKKAVEDNTAEQKKINESLDKLLKRRGKPSTNRGRPGR